MKTSIAFAVVLAVAATGAAAQQKMYKSIMPDGRVVYSEKPDPNAKKVDTVEAPPTAGISTVTPKERMRADQAKRDQQQTAQKDNALEQARKQLKQAETARDTGKEPREGERLGTAKGGSRLTDDYNARQKANEDAVTAAQKRVQELERR